ncbi:CBS domain-containing protein [Maricurvus nonylphenolicus]|uniref:CBS domain-containing protein n=1 Tax=Maricurvus nonylphenolicus TaxID=1008307 RepID=UPI0036F39406
MNNITAADIMSKDVLFAYEGWSIKYLATFLSEKKISGAPVVASDNELIGVVSVTDIFRFENQGDAGKVDALRDYYQAAYGNDIDHLELDQWTHNAEENCTVHQIMQKRVISVSEDTSISDIAKTMLINKIHRVFVTTDNKVVGIITTSNLLNLLAES